MLESLFIPVHFSLVLKFFIDWTFLCIMAKTFAFTILINSIGQFLTVSSNLQLHIACNSIAFSSMSLPVLSVQSFSFSLWK